MTIFSLSLWILLFFAVLTISFNKNPDANPDDVLHNLTGVHDTVLNLTTVAPYTNLYKEEISMTKIAYNIINPIIYAIAVEFNTLMPLAVYVASGSHADIIMKYLILIVVLYLLFAIPNLIKAIISIYFFVKEKKNYKEKIWH